MHMTINIDAVISAVENRKYVMTEKNMQGLSERPLLQPLGSMFRLILPRTQK
jgi:hypothetical protein